MTCPATNAAAFHRGLSGYAPTPVHQLDAVASEVGVGAVQVKDESSRFGLPAFKILGASWAVERALRDEPAVHTVAAARHGAHVGPPVIGIEPATAACLSASLALGVPTPVPTPGTTMAADRLGRSPEPTPADL